MNYNKDTNKEMVNCTFQWIISNATKNGLDFETYFEYNLLILYPD